MLAGVPILKRTVDAFLQGYAFDEVVVALPAELALSPPSYLESVIVVEGGERRQDSVANAFRAVAPSSQIIVIHDAARPLVSSALIERTIDAAAKHDKSLSLPSNPRLMQFAADGPTCRPKRLARRGTRRPM